jgi:hypothetical protein
VDTSASPIKIDEHFVEFFKSRHTSGKGLFNEIISVIKKILNLILMMYVDKDMIMGLT